MRKVLIISYYYPPLGGPGVQRALKFTKYLPEFGWEPHVLTVKEIQYYVHDPSLMKDIPPIATIYRTESLDPMRVSARFLRERRHQHQADRGRRNGTGRRLRQDSWLVRAYRGLKDAFVIPDMQVGWAPFAIRAGLDIIKRERIDVVLCTMPPFSSALIARSLKRRSGVPYVLDYRDSWNDDPVIIRPPTELHRKAHLSIEARCVSEADAVTVYGEWLRDRLVGRFPAIEGRCSVLSNGFDRDDLAASVSAREANTRSRLIYMGSLYEMYAPTMTTFLSALRSLPGEMLERLEVLFLGQSYAQARDQVRDMGLSEVVRFEGYVSHEKALELLMSSDGALLFLRRGDTSTVTGKVFEYLMAGLPIVACVEPDGMCAGVLREAGHDEWISAPQDLKQLTRNLLTLIDQGWPRPSDAKPDVFDRRNITAKLASVLESVHGASSV